MKLIKKNMSSPKFGIALIVAMALSSTATFAKSKDELTYPQVATGQVLAYDGDGVVVNGLKSGDVLYGQDAHYLKGAKMSYKDNGDGTVTDLNTGLMWQMVPIKQGFTWQGAQDYCESLELGGYSDWRVPSAKELYSISDFSAGWPYLDTNFFKLIDEERVGKDEQYWSSHKYVGAAVQGGSTLAFGVNHATGHIKAYGAGDDSDTAGERPQQRPQQARQGGQQQGGQRPPRDTTQIVGQQRPPRDTTQTAEGSRPERPQQARQGGQRPPQQARQGGQQGGGGRGTKYVRAVRGAEYGINNFVDNGDGTITDKATALMWAKVDSKEGMEWIKALKYAEDAELAGYSDWRLPNVKELQGIVDYNYAPSATDPVKVGAAIDPMFESTSITNENGDKDYPYVWTSTSALTRKNQPFYFAWYVSFGRAVSPEGIDSHGAGAVRFFSKYEGGPSAEGGIRNFNYVRLVRDVK